ncbi:MATE family efflux transporter [Brevundimonas sp. 2R-24]|uniref:Multidrug-efflux transporter n=1 Tax=Peiella sedimenti TaxID=3061083 RepID=A0ABT8SIV0_9CAUL|nr:MATE family efflux transporter [Caulobacteraceae bacterium XZ-24]
MTDALLSAEPPRRPTAALGELLRLAWPVVLARVGIMTMGLVDVIVVGRHSAEQLAYQALALAPISVVVTTVVGLLMGVQVMTSRLIGEGRPEETVAVLRRGCVYALQLGFGALLIMALLGPWAMRNAGLEPGLGEGASLPLVIFALSMPAYLLSVVGQLFLEAQGRPGAGAAAMIVANVVNLALNLWLVPGASGLPVEGAAASAWATFFARGLLAVVIFAFIFAKAGVTLKALLRHGRGHAADAREQRKIGLGAGSSYFIEVTAFAAMTFVAGWLGGLEVAAWTVILNIAAVIFMGPLGLSSATAVLVGRDYGAGQPHGVRQAGFLGMGVTAVLTGLIALGVWLFDEPLARAYTSDPQAVAIAVSGLTIACLFFVADGLQVVAAQSLRAAADVWWPTVMHIVSYGVVMLPLGWFLAHPAGLGVNGIVWAVVVASLISAGMLTTRFWFVSGRKLAPAVA